MYIKSVDSIVWPKYHYLLFLDDLDRSISRLFRIMFDIPGPLVPGAVPALTLSSMFPDPVALDCQIRDRNLCEASSTT